MISCKECGTENPDGARFCWSCGATIERPAAAADIVTAVPDQDCSDAAVPTEILNADAPAEEPKVLETAPVSNAKTIDFGSPASIDLGPADEPDDYYEPPKRESRRNASGRRPVRTESDAGIRSGGDPFNAKVLVMITGMLSLVISCYCLFGYRPTLTISPYEAQLMSIFGLNSIGASGIAPSDVISVSITITVVLAAISSVRPIPVITAIMGIITTLMYYHVKIDLDSTSVVPSDPLQVTVGSTSLTIMICLWIAVAALSVVQYIALKKYAASCPEEPCPLVRIWFGKL